MLALLNNYVEIRIDAHKVGVVLQTYHACASCVRLPTGISCNTQCMHLLMLSSFLLCLLVPLLCAGHRITQLLHMTRRPVPQGAEDIGTWFLILEIMGTIAVITNALLICFTSEKFTSGKSVSGKDCDILVSGKDCDFLVSGKDCDILASSHAPLTHSYR
jgi:hypothetical protein